MEDVGVYLTMNKPSCYYARSLREHCVLALKIFGGGVMCKSPNDPSCQCTCIDGCTEQCIKDYRDYIERKEKEALISDVQPSGTIRKEDCLDAANNLISDLYKENRDLTDKLWNQKVKAEKFENLLSKSEEKLAKTSELVRNAEKEVDALEKQKGQNKPQKQDIGLAWLVFGIMGAAFILMTATLLLQTSKVEKLENEIGTDKTVLISDLAKSKAEAEKIADENKKLTSEIEELKKKTAPPEPVEEKKEGEVKYKLTRYQMIGSFLGLASIYLFAGIVSAPIKWWVNGYERGGFTAWVVILILTIVSSVGSYYLMKPTPQNETVKVEQLQEPENKSVPVSQVSTPVKKQPAFIGNAKIRWMGQTLDGNAFYFFNVEFKDGRKANIFVDRRFFRLAEVGEVIAIYENDKIEFEAPQKEKKRVEY